MHLSNFLNRVLNGRRLTQFLFLLPLCIGFTARAEEILPKPEEPFQGTIGKTREESSPAWPTPVKPKRGAPNIVLILLDDVGFSAASTFGGAATTPELDKLAAQGLRYNNFNTVGICSPTRAALLTGRNHHQVGFGNLSDVAAGFPAYNSIWKKNTASIAEILRLNGYSTAAFGKWHNTPTWEISPVGPFDRWPTGLGFEYFYGFLFGETSEWEPRLYRDTVPVEHAPDPKYYLTTDLVDDAIHWIHQHDAVAAQKPYFIYFATGATHAPHHVPKEWIDKYKDKFDQGWDKLREESFARQKKLGVIPADALLTPRPDGLPAWDSLTPDQKKLYAHQMEVYAGYLSVTDYEVGRLLKDLQDSGDAQHTLVFYIVGDNGGSAEGGLEGSDTNFATIEGSHRTVPEMLEHLSDLGSVDYDNHYAAGWSWATSTPFQWMKQIASHFGATRDPLIVSWPGHTIHSEIIRSQFSHVNDIAPTIYDAAGITFPDVVNGVKQVPLEGKSIVPTFADPNVKSQHRVQYFEIFGNRAIYKDGWVAAARRYKPWEIFSNPASLFRGNFDKDRWELYHVDEDFSEANDLAAKDPQKLKELQAVFDAEAVRNGVYPLVPIPLVDAPTVTGDKSHFVYLSGVNRLPIATVPDLSVSHRLTAVVDFPDRAPEGVIVAEGGRYSGFSLYVKDGKLIYESNVYGTIHQKLVASGPLPKGKVQIVYEYAADPSKLTGIAALLAPKVTSGTGRLFIGDKKVGETHFAETGAFRSSINDTFDVGENSGSPVSRDYASPFPFNGKVERITIDLE